MHLSDIQATLKDRGFEPHNKPWMDMLYTCPVIEYPHDDGPSTKIMESVAIAKYLDKMHPETPPLFPEGNEALQELFLAR